MLNKKVTHGKLRPKAEKLPKYLAWLHEVHQPSCFVCNVNIGVQMHHVKRNSSDHKIDSEVIPLCYDHHLGNEFSAHGTPSDFRENYPMEVQKEYAKDLYSKYTDS